jgi:PAS domain S-box-containing protein
MKLQRVYRHPLWGYAMAIMLVAVAVGLCAGLAGAMGTRHVYLFLFPAVIIAALYGGLPAGLLATVLSAGVATWWIEPVGKLFASRHSADLLGLVAFILNCAMILGVCEAMRRAQARTSRSESEAAIAHERTQSEAALRKSEAEFRFLAENTGDILWLYDLQADRFTYVSPAVNRLRGFSPEEAIGQTMKDVLTPESLERIRGRLSARISALEAGDESARVQTDEVDQWRWDGSLVSMEVVTTLLLNEEGKVTRVIGVSRDMTERKKAEAALRESEERYRALFENMLNGFAYCRMLFDEGRPQDFIYLKVNKAFESLTGLKEVLGKKVTEVIPGIRESDPELFEIYGRVALGGRPERLEIFVKALGEWFSISVYSPQREYFVVVFDGITERKRAESALFSTIERLRLALGAAEAGTWEWDLKTDKNIWSEELWKLYGLEPHSCEPSYEAWLRTVHPEDRATVSQLVGEAVHSGTELDVEWRVRDPNGSERWLMSRARPMHDFDARAPRFVGIVMDITARKLTEGKLRNSLEEKVALLKEVHHRVKNNLQIVASLLDLQSNRVRGRDASEVLQDTRNRVHSIGLLHEALYQSGNLARVNFAAYVDELCRQLLGAFGSAATRVKVENRIASIGLPLEQSVPCGLIINELVSNSLKHGFPDARTGLVTIELYPADNKMLVLRVRDNGVGLAANSDVSQPSTLGLQLVSNLAGQLRGQLILDREGAGASFKIVFPAPPDFLPSGEI